MKAVDVRIEVRVVYVFRGMSVIMVVLGTSMYHVGKQVVRWAAWAPRATPWRCVTPGKALSEPAEIELASWTVGVINCQILP